MCQAYICKFTYCNDMGFKENLRDELTYRGILIKELAGMTGLNQGSISNYLRENSSLPSVDVAVKIARALDVTVEYLVTGKDYGFKEESPKPVRKYTSEIKTMADKLSKMSAKDRKYVSALINAIVES